MNFARILPAAPASAAQQKIIIATGLFIAFLLFIDLLHWWLFGRSAILSLGMWLVMRTIQGVDSWPQMHAAYDYFVKNPGTHFYQQVFFEQKTKFQYPPTSLLLFHFTDFIGWPLTDRAMARIGWIFVAVQIVTVPAIAVLTARRLSPPVEDRVLLALLAVVAAMATASFYPVMKAYSLGQIQAWLNSLFVLAGLFFLLGRPMMAGALIGAICVIKPHFSLFILWAALRSQWRFIIGWSLIAIPVGVYSLAVFGLANHFDYLSVLSYLSRHGEAYYPNQSFNGLINRLLGNGNKLSWDSQSFPPYNVIVRFGTLLTSLVLIAGAMLYRRRAASVTLADFLIAGLTFTVASPIAWEHHYGLLPAVFVVLWVPWVFDADTKGVSRGVILGLAFMFSSRWWVSADLLADTWLNVLQSYVYFSALALLWLLYVDGHRADLAPARPA